MRKGEASGAESSTRQLGEAEIDAPTSIALDDSGNILAAGLTAKARWGREAFGLDEALVRTCTAAGGSWRGPGRSVLTTGRGIDAVVVASNGDVVVAGDVGGDLASPNPRLQ